MWLVKATSKVWPSAGARATSMAAMLPPAPGLFSTITGWPSVLPMSSAISRASVSVVPPAVAPTISFMGLAGKAACAPAVAKAIRERTTIRRGVEVFMQVSFVG